MMIRISKTLIIGALVGLLSGCQGPENVNVNQNFWNEITSNYKGYDDLKESIEKHGHRLTGTENGKNGEEFMYNKLKGYGLEVNYDPFKVETWMRKTVSFLVNRNDKSDTLETVSLAFTPVKVEVSAQLIDVGNGLRTDFESRKESITGKLVLVNLGLELPEDSAAQNLHRSEKTALAIEYNASDVIFINPNKGGVLLTGTCSVTGSLVGIPAICISYEDGHLLRDQLKEGIKITGHIQMENESKMISARNVIATIKGSEKPDEKIIIGGHLDSWDLSDGAIDNGIGVYAIMDIARAFVVQKVIPKRTIEFAFWMGEEQGLNGSHAYVEKCLEDGSIDNIKYYINLDMSGNPSGFNLQGRPEMEQVILEIGKKIQEIDSTFKNEQKSKVSLHSDNVSFALEGIPVLHIIGNLDPIVYKYYHSNKDDFSLVNKEHMVYTSSVLGVFLNELSSLTEIPAKHYSSEETKNYYIEAGLKEKMMIGNEWKWEN